MSFCPWLPEPLKLKKGDKVRVTFKGRRTLDAHVLLVSPNGKSIALGFGGMDGGDVGVMPLLFENLAYRGLADNRPVEIVLAEEEPQAE